MSAYLQHVKALTDTLVVVLAPMDDNNTVFYILNGLLPEYNTFKMAIRARSSSLSFDELQDLLQIEEQQPLLSEQPAPPDIQPTSLQVTRRDDPPTHGSHRGHGCSRGCFFGYDRVFCQICKKPNHTALQCFYHLNPSYNPDDPPYYSPAPAFSNTAPFLPTPPRSSLPPVALLTTTSSATHTPWYLDTGANHHVTPDLSFLSFHHPYSWTSHVVVGDGQILPVSNTGSGILSLPSKSLQLTNILHVPRISTKLLSIHQLISNNNYFIVFHPSGFVIQDNQTKLPLYHGRSDHGLYPRPGPFGTSSPASSTALLSHSIFSSTLHNRLGHQA